MLELYLIYTSKFLENYPRYRVYIEYISGIYQVYIKYICYQETTDIEDFILDTYSIYTRFILGAPLLFLVVTPNIYSIYPRYILDIYPILTFFSILDMLLTFWSMRSIHTRHTRFILDLYSIYTMYYYDTRFILAHVLDTYLSVHHWFSVERSLTLPEIQLHSRYILDSPCTRWSMWWGPQFLLDWLPD